MAGNLSFFVNSLIEMQTTPRNLSRGIARLPQDGCRTGMVRNLRVFLNLLIGMQNRSEF